MIEHLVEEVTVTGIDIQNASTKGFQLPLHEFISRDHLLGSTALLFTWVEEMTRTISLDNEVLFWKVQVTRGQFVDLHLNLDILVPT